MRTVKQGCCAAGAVLLMAALTAAAESCEYTANRSAELPLSGITRVVIEAYAGALTITGDPGETHLRVEGKACASTQDMLDDVKLRTRTSGDTAYVAAEIPSPLWRFLDWTGGMPSLDLVIRMPRGTAIEVTDSSGLLEIRGSGRTEIDDGSGSILVTDTTGDLTLTDGSGSIELQGIGGDVSIEADGSGGMKIERVAGGVTIGADGSGGIAISHVERDVIVHRDGSGSILISNVRGDVVIHRDGSGSISVSDVGGSFIVEHQGSGGVSHERIKGTVRIDD